MTSNGSETSQGSTGTCYAHLFENPSAGLPKRLYWAFEFPVPGAGTVQVEWLAWGARSVEDLGGSTLKEAWRGDTLPEASCYGNAEHAVLKLRELTVREASRADLIIEAHFGPTSLGIPLRVRASVRFLGIVVVPDNINGCPTGETGVRALLSEYFNVHHLGKGEFDRFRYIFPPISAQDAALR